MSTTTRMADFGYLLCGLLLWAGALLSLVAERQPAAVRRNPPCSPPRADQGKPGPRGCAGPPCAAGGWTVSRS